MNSFEKETLNIEFSGLWFVEFKIFIIILPKTKKLQMIEFTNLSPFQLTTLALHAFDNELIILCIIARG